MEKRIERSKEGAESKRGREAGKGGERKGKESSGEIREGMREKKREGTASAGCAPAEQVRQCEK